MLELLVNNIGRANINIHRTNDCSIHCEIEKKLKYFLLDHGFYEVINPPFVSLSSDQAIKVDNPLDSNRQFIRTNISNSLVDNLLYNERRQKESIKLFEISDIYVFDNGINKKRMLSIIASGRVGLNYQDFSKKINIKYLEDLFKEICPNEVFDFKILSRDLLDTKSKNEIVSLELEISKFSNNILSYKEISQPPLRFNQFNPISDFPSSFKDISYLIKDESKILPLQNLLMNYQNDIVKKVYIFDYYFNKKAQEVKIDLELFFNPWKTLSSSEIELIYRDIINESLKIKGISILEFNKIYESRKKNIVKNTPMNLITINQSANPLDSFLSLLITKSKTKTVKLSGFGTFSMKTPKRIGRNPKTLISYIIPETNKLNFKPSQKLKEKLN